MGDSVCGQLLGSAGLPRYEREDQRDRCVGNSIKKQLATSKRESESLNIPNEIYFFFFSNES